jgi:hypothetical protein
MAYLIMQKMLSDIDENSFIIATMATVSGKTLKLKKKKIFKIFSLQFKKSVNSVHMVQNRVH